MARRRVAGNDQTATAIVVRPKTGATVSPLAEKQKEHFDKMEAMMGDGPPKVPPDPQPGQPQERSLLACDNTRAGEHDMIVFTSKHHPASVWRLCTRCPFVIRTELRSG